MIATKSPKQPTPRTPIKSIPPKSAITQIVHITIFILIAIKTKLRIKVSKTKIKI
jgi:hypothetical protein